MAGIGHEDAFPPHRLHAGYVIGKETVAWARGSRRDAPIAVIPRARGGFRPSSPSRCGELPPLAGRRSPVPGLDWVVNFA
jgi:hypothetical protein